MEVIERLRTGFRQSSTLMKIVWVNVGVFVILRLAAIVCVFSGNPGYIDVILSYIELPSSLSVLLSRPWTLLTYMFAQYDLLHIIFNMLWLYWFGTLFTMTASSRRLITLYLCGGLAGGILFMAGYAILPMFQYSQGQLIGSSASVIAIVTAVAIMMPHFKMYLMFFGSVSVKWIAIITIVLVLIGVTGSNAGGEVAHLGGVAAGVLYALWSRHAGRINSYLDNLSWSKRDVSESKIEGGGNTSPSGLTKEDSERLDNILDKIKKSGYSSLTQAERDRLFSVSRKIK